MKGEESFLQILTSLSSLFPDKFLSGFFHVVFPKGGNAVGIMFGL